MADNQVKVSLAWWRMVRKRIRCKTPVVGFVLNDMETTNAKGQQIGGTHYKNMEIQPVEYIHRNNLGFCEGCVIKYVSRWKRKGGIQDLLKAKHFIELLIEMEKEE